MCVPDYITITIVDCKNGFYLYIISIGVCFIKRLFSLYVFTAKCGGIRRDFHGTIASPNYPGSYEPNMECEYRIILGTNLRVKLDFETVHLRRWYPSIGMDEPLGGYNETYDDTLTVYDVDFFNNTSMHSRIFIYLQSPNICMCFMPFGCSLLYLYTDRKPNVY